MDPLPEKIRRIGWTVSVNGRSNIESGSFWPNPDRSRFVVVPDVTFSSLGVAMHIFPKLGDIVTMNGFSEYAHTEKFIVTRINEATKVLCMKSV